MSIAEKVARAIVQSSKYAGRTLDRTKEETEEDRVQNLLHNGPYGAYIVEGDPYEWGGTGAVATIFLEPHGGYGDCFPPLDYYREDEEDGFEVAFRATEKLGGYWIEFINPAVACVYQDGGKR